MIAIGVSTMKSKRLLPALRQYRHNDDSGFVFAYEMEETEAVFAQKQAEIDRLKSELTENRVKETDLIRKIASVFPVLCNESAEGKQFLLNLAELWSEEYKKELGI